MITQKIDGIILPSKFVDLVERKTFCRDIGSWQLKRNRDAFGNLLETELGVVYLTTAEIESESRKLKTDFAPDGCYGTESEYSGLPGFIEDIIDFAKVICFGTSGDGSPFCFDYRENLEQPNIIWWDDVYWRKVASNFEEFVGLFDLCT